MYITRTTSFPATCKRVQKLLKDGVGTTDVVVLNAMGAAITRCCDVALAVCHAFEGLVTNSVETSTTHVVDDFEPLTEVTFFYFPTCQLSHFTMRYSFIIISHSHLV